MRNKHKATLADIFTDPLSGSIPWKDVENMLVAAEAEISEGKGSRVRVFLNGARAVFHRPHPEKETDKGAVKSVRRFLVAAGITPDTED